MKLNGLFRLVCLAILPLLLISKNTFSQASFAPLNRDLLLPIENKLNSNADNFHSNSRPYLDSEIDNFSDTAFNPKNRLQKYIYQLGEPSKKDTVFSISLFPIITVLPGYDFSNTNAILDTRLGGKLNLKFKNKLALEFQLVNSNSDFANYWNQYSKDKKIMTGNGYAYSSDLGYTNLQWNGYVSFTANKYFNFAAGRGKNFFGDGYRSLFLSDVSSNYDYLKITTTIWKLKYVNLFTGFKDIRNSNGKASPFQNKYATFHYLSWNATKRINVSFFESVVWQSRDTNNRNLGYDVNYLNPIIFYRPTEYSLGSSDNALLGASFKIKLFKKQQLYGQAIFDEFLLKEIKAQNGWWANKYGFQVGLKSFDVFKIPNFYFQLEWNYVRPYTYSHSNTFQNYAHFNESLAHPLGANFSEYFANLNYQKDLLLFDLKITYANLGLDSAGKNYGQNIYLSNTTHESEYGNVTGQGLNTTVWTLQFTGGFLINKENNVRIEIGFAERFQKNTVETINTNYIFFGIRTALSNNYSDF